MNEQDDATLVLSAQSGDRDAFAELYNRYFDRLYDFTVRMTHSRDEALDVVQDTFIKAMNGLSTLETPSTFRAWLFSIARNATLSRFRREGRFVPLDADDGQPIFDAVDSDRFADPQEAVEAQDAAALVWKAAASLDPRQLSVLDLQLRQGLDSAEIGQVLGISKESAYVTVSRLKKAVEGAIRTLMLCQRGGEACPQLQRLLVTFEAEAMSPAMRRIVDRHAAECSACGERRRRMVPALAVFPGLAMVAPPAYARERIWAQVESVAGVAASARGGQTSLLKARGRGALVATGAAAGVALLTLMLVLRGGSSEAPSTLSEVGGAPAQTLGATGGTPEHLREVVTASRQGTLPPRGSPSPRGSAVIAGVTDAPLIRTLSPRTPAPTRVPGTTGAGTATATPASTGLTATPGPSPTSTAVSVPPTPDVPPPSPVPTLAEPTPSAPIPTPTPTPCKNDSDCDGFTNDSEAKYGSNPLSAKSTPESAAFDLANFTKTCNDGKDNDADGFSDSADPAC